MKIAAVVMLYHPGDETVAYINSYRHAVDKVFVFDNTESGCTIKDDLLLRDKLIYFHDGKNKGIAKRLNEAAQIAIDRGFNWLLMMDQDSCFTISMINQYLTCLNNYENKEAVAMFGVKFEQVQSFSTECNPVSSDELITSGTLLNLSLYKKIGLFDENLFIDGVDHEYTIRTKNAGYKIIQFPNIQLTHQLGTLTSSASIKTLYLIKKEKKLHSPLRCYYVYRNNLYLQDKYKNTHVALMQKLDKIARSIIHNNLFYGKSPIKLIRYLLKAKRDFEKNRMGELSDD